MMLQNRDPAPNYLQENYKAWGREYAQKRALTPKIKFPWKKYEDIRQKLSESTKGHCSYCDGYPLEQTLVPSIDHFRPKSKYPRLAYVWCNLFYCCSRCQSVKSDKFNRKFLKPDVIGYSFERYFIVNYRTGEIEVNQAAPIHDQERAELTIKIAFIEFGKIKI